MRKAKSRTRAKKPLLQIRKPLRISVYRGKFQAFEATKFLDEKALKAAKKVTIECGTVEAAGIKQTVAAEIRYGVVVALKPIGCAGCEPKTKPRKLTASQVKQTIRQIESALIANGLDQQPPKPIPLKISRSLGFEIPFGPIIIVIGDPSPGGFDLCFQWWFGNELCWWCLFGANGCITFG